MNLDALAFSIEEVSYVPLIVFLQIRLGLLQPKYVATKDKSTQTEKKSILWSYFS